MTTAQVQPGPPTATPSEQEARSTKKEPLPGLETTPRHLQSHALLQGQSSVSIQHKGSVYRLQETKLGKLILTK